jgi:hypothetical protein
MRGVYGDYAQSASGDLVGADIGSAQNQATAADIVAQEQANTPNTDITKPSSELELAREVQLTLTAGLFAIKDPDTQSRKRSQLKFLTVLVESLLEEIEARYGILPDSQTERLFALADQASDTLEQMP